MNRFILPLLILTSLLLGPSDVDAQRPVNCDVLRFRAGESAFIEVHLDFESRVFLPSTNGETWATHVLVEAVVESSEGIVNYGKSTIHGPEAVDSISASTGNQFHLERIPVPPGSYNVAVTLRDMHPASNVVHRIDVPIRVLNTDMPAWSDPFIVEAFARTEANESTLLSRSGFEMLPVVSAELSADAGKLQFYSELYRSDEVVDSLLLVSCWLEDQSGMVVPSTRRFFRETAASVLPIFTSIPLAAIGDLNQATLKVQAVTTANEVIAENSLPVVFVQPASFSTEGIQIDGIPSHFQAFTDSLALVQHIRDHHPKADASQRKTIDGYLSEASVREMQAFLTHFWESNAPDHPELGWRTYATAIAYADSTYGACRNGHGAETDMGYIYLRYGPPNTIVKRHNETDYYPYEIWHYHRAGPFTNKRFLFFSPHMVAECFTLLHSDMLGEVQNADWLHQLRNRENRLRVTDSQLNRLNPRRDTFSGEEPEDLFFNPR